jgi:hypothetical protein
MFEELTCYKVYYDGRIRISAEDRLLLRRIHDMSDGEIRDIDKKTRTRLQAALADMILSSQTKGHPELSDAVSTTKPGAENIKFGLPIHYVVWGLDDETTKKIYGLSHRWSFWDKLVKPRIEYIFCDLKNRSITKTVYGSKVTYWDIDFQKRKLMPKQSFLDGLFHRYVVLSRYEEIRVDGVKNCLRALTILIEAGYLSRGVEK